MKRYEMNKQKEGSITYFFIRDTETWDIVLLPTKYLMHMTKAKCSPNTVRRSGCSILYYLEYSKTDRNSDGKAGMSVDV